MTPEGFLQICEDDFSWRFEEINTISRLIDLNAEKETLIRCSLVMLYAHWEGHFKFCCDTYLKAISSQKVRYDKLERNFIWWMSNENTKRFQGGTKNLEEHCEIVEDIFKKRRRLASNLAEKRVDTKSKLNWKQTRSILGLLGISVDEFEKFERPVERLVGLRNQVSHGEAARIGSPQNAALRNEILQALRTAREHFTDSLLEKRYLVA